MSNDVLSTRKTLHSTCSNPFKIRGMSGMCVTQSPFYDCKERVPRGHTALAMEAEMEWMIRPFLRVPTVSSVVYQHRWVLYGNCRHFLNLPKQRPKICLTDDDFVTHSDLRDKKECGCWTFGVTFETFDTANDLTFIDTTIVSLCIGMKSGKLANEIMPSSNFCSKSWSFQQENQFVAWIHRQTQVPWFHNLENSHCHIYPWVQFSVLPL